MAKRFLCLVVLAAICLVGSTELMAQVASTGQLVGTVTDQTGAVIAGATVKIKDDATGALIETKSSAEGHFSASNLRPGNYTVTVGMTGFKAAEFRAVKITIGQVYDLTAKLEVGALESTVVVEAGAEVLETASTTIGTSITGKSITQLPLVSRSALDLATLMPGASTVGRTRDTSFMGLPKGAINITLDGINSQDNVLKSNDGFFTLIATRTDSIEEFSISTAGQGSEQSGEGAVQIRFETKRGGNVYHGGGWWYHRNDFLNANYYFNNEVAPGKKSTPRPRQRLNQFGGQIGGPIWKEKLFFFVSVDNYRNPSSTTRTRTIFSANSFAGKFDYIPTAAPTAAQLLASPWLTCSGSTCTADLLAYASTHGLPSIPDPMALTLLTAVNSARTAPGVTLASPTTPWVDNITFNNPGNQTRRFPDVRLDYNITRNIQWTGIYHYNYYTSSPDTLNSFDMTYPVAPYNKNQGTQLSNRNEWITAVRWNIGTNKSNEVRAGLVTSPVIFFPDLDNSLYPSANTNLGGIHIRRSFPSISNPILAYSTQGRNAGPLQLLDTFSWSRGKHNMMFGGDWTRIRYVNFFASRFVNTASLGLNSSDPANSLISSAIINGGTNDPGNARNLYASLMGIVTSYSGTISVDENARVFKPGASQLTRAIQHEFGFYANDSWRALPQLTINYGLRWEIQRAPTDPKNISFRTVGGYPGVWGVSGLNNLFKPGTLPGSITQFELNGSREWYQTDYKNFAPNLGLAWTPSFSNKMWKTLFGESGKTIIRSAFSVNFTREGLSNFSAIAFSNPGIDGSIFSSAVAPSGACAPPYVIGTLPGQFTAGTFPAGCLTLTGLFNGDLQTLTTSPPAFPTTPFQLSAQSGQSVNMFEPGLKTPAVYNWSFGIQREVSPSLVVEVRYIGNHGNGLWRQDNFNEVNIFENGFLTEFGNAVNNLNIYRAANPTCGVTPAPPCRFSNQGLPGQVAVPIFTQMFTGSQVGSQTGGNFNAGTTSSPTQFGRWLANGAAGSFANNVYNSTTFLCNLVGSAALAGALPSPCAGTAPVGPTPYPVNFWVANPHAASGGAFRMNNGGHSTYNGLTVEVRKRYSKGMQFSGNYTFSKSLTNYYGNSASSFTNFTTLRNPGFDKGPSPWDLRHSFKFNMIYSFPFGPGRKWNSSHAFMNRIIEGWEISAVNRWQSGRVFQLTSGGDNLTLNSNDPGVILKGISIKQIQKSLGIRKLPNSTVFYFPASLIAANGTGTNTASIAACNTAGLLCQKVFLYGPTFFRTDINVVKKFKIYERYEFEFRAEFLNAFNNINFLFPGNEGTVGGSSSAAGAAFGQVTSAFRDVNSTEDNGGRIIQMVLRVRF